MNAIQRRKKLWRIPLIVAILFILFWGTWSFFSQVPVTEHLTMIDKWTIQFPFLVSRWLDVIFAPLLIFVLVLIFSSQRYKKDKEEFAKKDKEDCGGAGLAGGSWSCHLGLTLMFAILLGMGTGLGFGRGPGESFLASLGICLLFSLLVNLIWGLLSSLISGLTLTLVFSLFTGFGLGLVLSLVVILQYLFIKREFWASIGRWLTAK